jgi:hypothetical protein
MNKRLKLGGAIRGANDRNWVRLDRQSKRRRLRSTKFAGLNDEFQDAIVRYEGIVTRYYSRRKR